MFKFGGNNQTRAIPADSTSLVPPPPPNVPNKLNVENRSPDYDSDDDPIARQFTPCGWTVWWDTNHKKFYYADKKHTTTWDRPTGITIEDERRAFIRDFLVYELKNVDNNRVTESCVEYLQSLSPTMPLYKHFEGTTEDQKQALILECASAIFRALLDKKMMDPDEHKRLKTTSSWEAASKLLHNDRRFHLISRPSEKKAVFNEWKKTAPKREKEARVKLFDVYCRKLKLSLSTQKEFNVELRYSKANELYSKEDFWKEIPSSERRAIFDEVMRQVHLTIEQEEERYRKENIQAFGNILKDMQNITCETSWGQAQRLLAQNPSFQSNLSLMNMDKEDALAVFQTHIRALIAEYRDMRERKLIAIKRKERKTRDNFQKYLIQLRDQSVITLNSKWKELSPLISKNEHYLDMLRQSGPTPLDFFKFFVDDWNQEFNNNLNFVLELMEKKDFEFTLSVTSEAFISFLEDNTKPDQVSKINYTFIYDHLLRDLIEKASKQENAAESLRSTFLIEFGNIQSNSSVDIRDIEAVCKHFKSKWQINEKVEAMVLKVRQEYLARNNEEEEEGEIFSQSLLSNSPLDKKDGDASPHSSNSPSPHNRKRKHKKEKEKKSRRSEHSSERDKTKKKKHRRHRSSSVDSRDDDDRYHRDRSHKSSRKH